VGRRHISTSGFASTATETAVFALLQSNLRSTAALGLPVSGMLGIALLVHELGSFIIKA